MEAMAGMMPWVSFPVGNMKNFKGGFVIEEDVTIGMNGKVRPGETAKRLFCNKIGELIDDFELRDKLGMEGWEQIKQEYSLDVVIDKYKEVICG